MNFSKNSKPKKEINFYGVPSISNILLLLASLLLLPVRDFMPAVDCLSSVAKLVCEFLFPLLLLLLTLLLPVLLLPLAFFEF